MTSDVLDRIVTKSDGRVAIDLDGITYWASPLSKLDENIHTCISGHRDLLLDARLHLYGTAEEVDRAAAAQWVGDSAPFAPGRS